MFIIIVVAIINITMLIIIIIEGDAETEEPDRTEVFLLTN